MLYSLFLGLHTWCWILALLALARQYLSGTNRFLKYASRASYPFYILHFLLMIIIGHFTIQWHLGIAAEFISLSLLTFIATFGSYELMVKRTKVTRVLFGMKA
jgi:glucan biosynthesis protein C